MGKYLTRFDEIRQYATRFYKIRQFTRFDKIRPDWARFDKIMQYLQDLTRLGKIWPDFARFGEIRTLPPSICTISVENPLRWAQSTHGRGKQDFQIYLIGEK